MVMMMMMTMMTIVWSDLRCQGSVPPDTAKAPLSTRTMQECLNFLRRDDDNQDEDDNYDFAWRGVLGGMASYEPDWLAGSAVSSCLLYFPRFIFEGLVTVQN